MLSLSAEHDKMGLDDKPARSSLPHSPFYADRPARGRADDRLSRAAFSDSLAQAIGSWRGNDSLVIALFGPWGTGKSSVKNMIAEALTVPSRRAIIANFNPWQFANQDRLGESFFDELGRALGKSTIASGSSRRELVRKWKVLAAYLGAASPVTGAVQKMAALALAPAVLIIATSIWPQFRTPITGIGVIIGLLASLFAFSARAAEYIAAVLAIPIDAGRKTLDEIRKELEVDLRKMEQPVLVVLDDVDRLTPAETLEVVQLVKANADLPNIVYLLLCDREVVERHLEAGLGVNGRNYLEKIVQVAFDLPRSDRRQVHKYLFEELDTILGSLQSAQVFDRVRWGNLFVGGLDAFIVTLRDAKRLLSSLAVHVRIFQRDGTFEVNPIDLIAIEMLRVFEPEIYKELAASKDTLTGEHSWDDSSRARERNKKTIDDMLSRGSSDTREATRRIVIRLFPHVSYVLQEHVHGVPHDLAFRELRVCSPRIFDRYFAFDIPAGDISQSGIEALLASMRSRTSLRSKLEELAKEGKTMDALDRLEAYKTQLPQEHSEDIVTGFFDASETLSDERDGFMAISEQFQAIRLLYAHLRQDPDPQHRLTVLLNAINNTEGFALPIEFVSLEDPRDKRGDAEREEHRLVDDAGLAALQQACVAKIERAVADNSLQKYFDASILFRWKEWAGPQRPRAFAEQLASTADGALRILHAFVGKVHSQGLGDAVSSVRWHIRLKELEQFVSLEHLEPIVNGLDVSALPEEQQRDVKAFRDAVARRRAGKPDFADSSD